MIHSFRSFVVLGAQVTHTFPPRSCDLHPTEGAPGSPPHLLRAQVAVLVWLCAGKGLILLESTPFCLMVNSSLSGPY